MKKLVFIISLLVLLKPVLPLVEYVFKYEYISKVLCENKAQPKLGCNGKCHLKKELAKAADTDPATSKQLPAEKKSQLYEIEMLFFQELSSFSLPGFFSTDSVWKSPEYSDLYCHQYGVFVFHPPSFLPVILS